MALTWTNHTPTPQWATLDPHTQESLIWRCLHLGIPEITEENAADFFDRSARLDAAYLNEHYLTFADCRAGIGLKTNAAPKTPAAFNKFVAKVTAAYAS